VKSPKAASAPEESRRLSSVKPSKPAKRATGSAITTYRVRSGDTASLAIMVVLAVVIAPVTEELVFRVGLFRWLRTRPLRGVALFVPAAGFAALHGYLAVFLPIVVLAVCLALAYERSGHPLVPITAHALFNLNTVVLLLAGFPV
jgi:membrane protease YdiL (CAAX protease family)